MPEYPNEGKRATFDTRRRLPSHGAWPCLLKPCRGPRRVTLTSGVMGGTYLERHDPAQRCSKDRSHREDVRLCPATGSPTDKSPTIQIFEIRDLLVRQRTTKPTLDQRD